MNDAIIDDDYQNMKCTTSSTRIYPFTLSYGKWQKSFGWKFLIDPDCDKHINFQLPTQEDFIGLKKKKNTNKFHNR